MFDCIRGMKRNLNGSQGIPYQGIDSVFGQFSSHQEFLFRIPPFVSCPLQGDKLLIRTFHRFTYSPATQVFNAVTICPDHPVLLKAFQGQQIQPELSSLHAIGNLNLHAMFF